MKHKYILRIARIGVLTAMALILVVIEQMLPPLLAFAPGAKIGISNIVVLLAIVTLGYLDAGIILLIKCVFGAVFGGNIFGLVYSLGGGLCAYAVMSILYRLFWKKLSIVSISIAGAVIHNAIQTAIAAAVVTQINYLLLLPFMLIASVLAGLAVGFCCYLVLRFVPVKVLVGEERAEPPDQKKGSAE